MMEVNGLKVCLSRDRCFNLNIRPNGLLPVSEFYKSSREPDGLQQVCKACSEKYQKEYFGRKERIVPPVGFKACSRKSCSNPNTTAEGFLNTKFFGVRRNTKDGFSYWCSFCRSQHDLLTRESINKYKKCWDKRRRSSNIQHRLAGSIRAVLRSALKRALAGKHVSAVHDLGCTVDYFIKYVECLWLPGMSWSNYGRGLGKWNIDHKIALIRPGQDLESADTQRRLVHYTNLQPLWAVDNIRKGNR
jgi:hypothetical protein